MSSDGPPGLESGGPIMTALLEAPRCRYLFTAAGEHAATQDATVTTMPRWIVRSPRLVHLTVAAARPAITAQGLRPASWLVERGGRSR